MLRGITLLTRTIAVGLPLASVVALKRMILLLAAVSAAILSKAGWRRPELQAPDSGKDFGGRSANAGEGLVRPLKGKTAAFSLIGLTLVSSLLGCASQEPFSGEASKKTQDQISTASSTTDSGNDTSLNPSNDTSPAPTSSSPAPDNASTPVAKPVSVANESLPAEYILDQNCEKGTGQTGLDIYYKLLPSDSLRYACVHRVGTNPYINYGDGTFAQSLADVGGTFCAFSSVSNNVGCALTPITSADLMNMASPREQEQPIKSEPPKQSTPTVKSGSSKQSSSTVKSEPPKQSTPKVKSESSKQSSSTVKSESSKQSTPTVRSGQDTPDQQPPPSNNGTGGLSNDDYYTNSKGNEVHVPAYSTDGSVPSGATAKCADGTYSFSQSRSGTCSSHGGVSQWLN